MTAINVILGAGIVLLLFGLLFMWADSIDEKSRRKVKK